jgi:hypothetical protein
MRGPSGTRNSSLGGARSRTRARSSGNTCKHRARRTSAPAKAVQCGHANPGAEWRPDSGRCLTTHSCRSVELDQSLIRPSLCGPQIRPRSRPRVSTSNVPFFCFCSASWAGGQAAGLAMPSTGFRRRADLSGVFRISSHLTRVQRRNVRSLTRATLPPLLIELRRFPPVKNRQKHRHAHSLFGFPPAHPTFPKRARTTGQVVRYRKPDISSATDRTSALLPKPEISAMVF